MSGIYSRSSYRFVFRGVNGGRLRGQGGPARRLKIIRHHHGAFYILLLESSPSPQGGRDHEFHGGGGFQAGEQPWGTHERIIAGNHRILNVFGFARELVTGEETPGRWGAAGTDSKQEPTRVVSLGICFRAQFFKRSLFIQPTPKKIPDNQIRVQGSQSQRWLCWRFHPFNSFRAK